MDSDSRSIDALRIRLRAGMVIPAHPLALTEQRMLDERHQRALTRYYLAAGAGGLAVGVHTTQFAIRDPSIGLYDPVLEIAAETARESASAPVLIAGACGETRQAISEAETAAAFGYDCVLLSLAALRNASDAASVAHCRAVSEVLPLLGFYLQPGIGGRSLSYGFWRAFLEIEQVVAIKVAPFDRYHTLDVVRALAESGRSGDVALYTGNDDAIVADLVTPFRFGSSVIRFTGGLLGQWAVGTQRAVNLLARIKAIRDDIPATILAEGMEITDTNAALFDAANGFAGCIPGIHEVLHRQGLLAGTWCLNPAETLSPGQREEIDRVLAAYPHLHDTDFIGRHLDDWLR